MANDDVKIGITAEDTGVQAELRKVSSAVSHATNEIKEKFAGISEAVEKVQGVFLAFTAVLAGGKLFKEVITETVTMTKNAIEMGEKLGVSATEAGVLAVALDDVHVSQEQFGAGGTKIAAMLKKNEEAFKNLGVATRDQNGNFRNQVDIQMDVNKRLLEFKEGTDRNVEGIKIYGKAWGEIIPTLRLTGEVMEAARLKSDALGLTIGEENVAATQQYRSAMNDVEDVMKALEKVIGDAVLPVLTSLGKWFGEKGPALVNIFRAAIFTIQSVFIQFKGVIVNWVDSIAGSLDIAGAYIGRFSAYAERAMHLDFAGASAAWDAGTQHIADRVAFVKGVVADDAAEMAKALQDAMDKSAPGNQTPAKQGKSTETSDGSDAKLQNQMSALNAELEAKKVAYQEQQRLAGSFREFEKEQEVKFWQDKLKLPQLSQANELAIKTTINRLKLTIDKQGYQEELAAIKEQQAKYKNNLQEKLAIALEYQAKVVRAEGGDSTAARSVGAEVITLQRQIGEQKVQIEEITQSAMRNIALADLAEKQAILQDELANRRITADQLLDAERNLATQRLQIQSDALQQKIALAMQDPDQNVVALAQLNAQKVALVRQSQIELAAIDRKIATEAGKDWTTTFKNMESGFSSVIANFMKGTMRIRDLFRNLFVSVADSIAQMAAKNVANMAMQALQGKKSALKELNASAVAGAGAAYKATVGIPYVGPFLAPAAAAVAYGGIMAFGSQMSAEKGYDVPAGVSPLTQLHQREMVLPAKYADTIRDLSEGGGGSARNAGPTVTINISAMDSKSVMDRSADIAAAIKKHLKGTGRLVPSY